jgi:hypothetical protein
MSGPEVTTTTGKEAWLGDAALKDFGASLRGELLAVGDEGYQRAMPCASVQSGEGSRGRSFPVFVETMRQTRDKLYRRRKRMAGSYLLGGLLADANPPSETPDRRVMLDDPATTADLLQLSTKHQHRQLPRGSACSAERV